jgi:GTP 3',8-cyclase
MDEVVPSAQIIERIDREVAPLDAIDPNYPGEVAERWRYRDGGGEIGVISSVTQAFCGSCTRARLSTEGMLYLCLFAGSGYDLRRILRGTGGAPGADDAVLAADIAQIWSQRADRYSELRSEAASMRPKVEMSYIGG